MTSFRYLSMTGVAALTLAFAWVSGCSSTSKRTQVPHPSATETSKPMYGPPVPAPAQPYGPEPGPAQSPTVGPQIQADYGPQPESTRPLVVVLGPGMARGFAHVGAIRALSDAQIPIAAVVGTDMGGLVGAAYAMNGKANVLDWTLTRIKPGEFRDGRKRSGGFLGGRDALSDDLKKVFGAQDLSRGKVPVRIGLSSGGSVVLVERGPAADAVRAALGDEAHPSDWLGTKAFASSAKKPFLTSEARALGLGPVLLIDTSVGGVKGDPGADLVIRPDLHGIGDDDFEKKTEAVFRGKKAVKAKLDEIRALAGLKKGSGS